MKFRYMILIALLSLTISFNLKKLEKP